MRRTDRELNDRSEMIDVLQRGDVCHLALVDGDKPYIVALNYGYEWTGDFPTLYFHCAPVGKKIDVIRVNNSGCCMVDVDHVLESGEKGCDWGMRFKSIVAYGTLHQLDNTADKKHALDLLMLHHAGGTGYEFDEKILSVTTVLQMNVTGITAKKKGT